MADAGLLPGPAARRSGYLVYTQTIYPGNGIDLRTAPIEDQTEAVLRELEAILAGHSCDLSGVVRCEVMLASPDDFYEFNLVWRRVFPDDPPARWTIAVGDTHPVPGARIALHAVAVPRDSGYTRELVSCDEIPDSLVHEHCAQAVKVGDYVFPSPVAGIEDYERGIVPDPSPLTPPAAAQFRTLMDRNQRLLGQVGTSLAHTVKTQNMMLHEGHADPALDIDRPVASEDWLHINPLWGQYMEAPPPPRTSVAAASLIVPGALTLPNITVLVPREGNEVEELRKGVRFVPIDHGWQFSAAIQTADYMSLAGHISIDYTTLESVTSNPAMPHLASDIEVQVDYVLEDRLAIVEAGGLTAEAVCEAKVFLAAPRRDLRGFWRAWQRWFPAGGGPAVQVIPVTGIHFAGSIVEIELLAERGA
jgi:enamine deaminase RidA (YjgF/YER057c/UK114 family)